MSAIVATAPRLYVDSADTERVGALLRAGLVHGVTTNPTILERHGHTVADLPELYRRWEGEGAREIFFQAWGEDAPALRACAERLAGLGERVAVKIPATPAGFAAASAVVDAGTPVLLTAVYSVAQALAAASIGVSYIAPYLGRMRDAGMDADAIVPAMQAVCASAGTNVLLASLRSPEDVVAMRLAGISLFTAAPDVLDQMLRHDVSDSSAAEFELAMGRIGG